MGREKIIEEMAEKAKEIIEDECLIGKIVYGCTKCSYRIKRFPICQYWLLAERLIDDDYTKIPEGAVVLTREELETTDKIPHKIKDFYKWFIEIEKEQASKETAKKVLDEVSKHYGGSWLVALYKKYGVEVDE